MSYADLLIWQYKGQSRAVATARLFDTLVAPTWAGFQALLGTYDINNATGVSLDVIGRIVGISRTLTGLSPRSFFGFNGDTTQTPPQTAFPNPNAGPFTQAQHLGGQWYRYGGATADNAVANDDEYRLLIKLKVIKNYQTGTLENVMNALNVLLGGPYANAIDNYDMTVTVYAIKSRVTPFVQFVLDRLDLLPRPTGVGLTINTSYDFDPTVFPVIERIVNVELPAALKAVS